MFWFCYILYDLVGFIQKKCKWSLPQIELGTNADCCIAPQDFNLFNLANFF